MFSIFIYVSLILSFAVCAGLSVYLWPARRSSIHALVLLTQACYALWAFLILVTWFAPELQQKIFLTQIRQVFLPVLMPTWPLIALGIFYRPQWTWFGKKRYWVYAFPLVVIIGNIISMTGWTGAQTWGFFEFSLNPETNLLDYRIGGLLRANFLYGYVGVLALHLLYLYVLMTRPREQKWPVILLLAASVFHLTFEIVGRWFLQNSQMMQVSVAFIWPAAIALHYAASRLQLLDIGSLAYEKVFAQLPNPVLIFDSRKKFWNGNPAAHDVLDLKNTDSTPNSLGLMGQDSDLLRIREKSYQVIHHELLSKYHSDVASVFILNDVTEMQEQNETLRSVHEQLMRAMRFNHKVQTVLSHDLSGVLVGQKLLLDKIRRQSQEQGGESEEVQVLMAAHESTTQLLNDVLIWSQEGDVARTSSVQQCFEKVKEQLSSLLHTQRTQLKMDFLEDEVFVNGSGKLLESIFRNLLSNAIKFAPVGASVRVGLYKETRTVKIVFEDQGIGLTAEQIEKILQGHSYRAGDHGGFGMGLRFTLRFIEQLGGAMAIESKVGEGSKFILTLPVA